MVSPPSSHPDDSTARRREVMRRELLAAMRAHHDRRRRRRRAGAALLMTLALGAALWFGLPRPEGPSPLAATDDRRPTLAGPDANIPPRRSVMHEVVATRIGAARRYIASPPSLIELIDDRELLDSLASLNRPAGIIRTGGQVALTRPVADAIDQPQ